MVEVEIEVLEEAAEATIGYAKDEVTAGSCASASSSRRRRATQVQPPIEDQAEVQAAVEVTPSFSSVPKKRRPGSEQSDLPPVCKGESGTTIEDGPRKSRGFDKAPKCRAFKP